MVNFTGRKTPSTQCALIGPQLQVSCKICCKFSSGNIKRKISTSDFQSEADEYHEYSSIDQSSTWADRVWSNPKKSIYQSPVSKM